MRFGINVPNFGELADPTDFAEFARVVETSGWDGLFVWDHIIGMPGAPAGDPIVQLAAAATITERIRLGPMVTPLARRRPWKVAREIASLDRLSNGRTIFGAGLGVPVETDFAPFGEEVEDRMRAERLDEGLEILVGLWTGEPFGFSGTHFDVDEVVFTPTPVQRPRVPIWTACMLPNTKPLERAARWDGVVPFVPDREMTAADITFVVDQISTPPGTEPFDVVFLGTAAADTDVVRDVAAAGATWWHALPTYGGAFAEFEAAVRRGPPTF